jgi:hypothetical protein
MYNDVFSLETVQHNTFAMTNFLVHQKGFHVCSLITRKLNDFPRILVLLDGTVATEILLERFANPFDIQVIGQTGDGCDTFSSVTLLHTNVNLFFSVSTGIVSGVLEGVCVCVCLHEVVV